MRVLREEFWETDQRMLEMWMEENRFWARERYTRWRASVRMRVMK